MDNKKRWIVAIAFLFVLFFMTIFAGGTNQKQETPLRNVVFVDGFNDQEISNQQIELGKGAEVPEAPEHRDYLFVGWYDEDDNKLEDFSVILKDLRVIAKYGDDKNNNKILDELDTYYNVVFYDTEGRVILKTQSVLTGMNATAPTPNIYPNLTFTGWSGIFTNVLSHLRIETRYARQSTPPLVTPPGLTDDDGQGGDDDGTTPPTPIEPVVCPYLELLNIEKIDGPNEGEVIITLTFNTEAKFMESQEYISANDWESISKDGTKWQKTFKNNGYLKDKPEFRNECNTAESIIIDIKDLLGEEEPLVCDPLTYDIDYAKSIDTTAITAIITFNQPVDYDGFSSLTEGWHKKDDTNKVWHRTYVNQATINETPQFKDACNEIHDVPVIHPEPAQKFDILFYIDPLKGTTSDIVSFEGTENTTYKESSIKPPQVTALPGYIFTGWDTVFNENDIITGAKTFIAQFEEEVVIDPVCIDPLLYLTKKNDGTFTVTFKVPMEVDDVHGQSTKWSANVDNTIWSRNYNGNSASGKIVPFKFIDSCDNSIYNVILDNAVLVN